jgi:hypothetical protein
MIAKMDFKNLRNSEFMQFFSQILVLAEGYGAETLGIYQEYDALKSALGEASAVFVKDRVTLETKELQALDNLRDDLLNGLITLVRGYSYSPHPPVKKSSRLLEIQLRLYGRGTARENYHFETQVVSTLVQDLTERPELAQAAEMLHLTEWVQQLGLVNKEFYEKYLSRTKIEADIPDDTFTQLRPPIVKAFHQLRDRLGAFYTLNHGEAPYGNIANDIRALVDQYKKVVAVRQGRKPPPANETGA